MNCLMIVEKHPKWSTALLTPIMRYIPFLCVHHHTLARICRRSTHLWVTYNTHSSCCDELNDRMKEKKNTHTARINPSTRFNLHQLIHPLRQIRCIYIHFLSLLFMKSNAISLTDAFSSMTHKCKFIVAYISRHRRSVGRGVRRYSQRNEIRVK